MLKQVTGSKLFIRTFLTYIIILVVPIYIFSLISYNYAIQKIRNDGILQYNQDIKNTASLIDDQLLNIQTLSERINMLSWVWRLTAEGDIFKNEFDAVRKKEIINDLTIFMGDNGLINNIILLFPQKNAAVSLNGWFEIDSYFNYLGENYEIQELKNNISKRYNFDILYSDKLSNSSKLWLIHSIDKISKPRAQLVFLIDMNKFKRFISSIAPDNLCSFKIYSMDDTPVLEVQGKGNKKSGNLFSATVPSNAFGWKYDVTFDASFTEAKQNEFLFLVITCLITLVLAPIAAFLLAFVSHSPIKKMMRRIILDSNVNPLEKKRFNEYNILENAFSQLKNDNRQMESRIKEYSKYTQNDMLIRLLKGYFYESEHEELPYYGINYSDENRFAVLVISVIQKDVKKDYQLKKIMMAGLLIEKILEKANIDFKIIDIMEEDVVVILSDSISKLETIDINQLSDNIQNALKDIESTETHIWCGKIEKGILGISKSYHDAKETESMNIFTQNMQQKTDITISFYYPTDWEIQLINNLKMGKEDSVKNILNELQLENEKRLLNADMKEALYKSINNTILRVAIELNIDWLEKEMEKNMQQYMESYEASSDTYSDKWAYIHATCNMICKRTTYQSQENNDISKRILEYIQQNYTNPGLSLKEISSDVSVSLSAASKAFKNAYGINFYDYTCRLRMEKAKELLKESKLAVKDICKEVGYENEFSLRRTFLRYEGVSISDYRNSLQK